MKNNNNKVRKLGNKGHSQPPPNPDEACNIDSFMKAKTKMRHAALQSKQNGH